MEKTKLTTEEINTYLATVADIMPWDPGYGEPIDGWYSKTDKSYITFTNIVQDVDWIAALNLQELQSTRPNTPSVVQIGFCADTQKWYGWSHRGRGCFGIGSKIEKGYPGYKGRNEEEFIEQCLEFWKDEHRLDMAALFTENENGEKGVQLTYRYSDTVPNEDLRGTVGDTFLYLGTEGFGKGEWTAESLDDAKQMASDFAKSLS